MQNWIGFRVIFCNGNIWKDEKYGVLFTSLDYHSWVMKKILKKFNYSLSLWLKFCSISEIINEFLSWLYFLQCSDDSGDSDEDMSTS